MVLSTFLGGKLYGERYGGGTPRVLALHGWCRDRSDFASLLNGLDAVAIDLPGFGLSPIPPEPWGSTDYAMYLAPLLEDFLAPVVVGHSFGGRVALQLAALFPGAIRSVVLTGVPLLRPRNAPSRSPLYRSLRGANRLGLLSDPAMEKVRSRFGSTDYRRAEGVMREVLVRVVNESYELQLRDVRCPVDLVWGELDTAVPVAVAQRVISLIPNSTLTVCAGADHITCLLRPELNEALERALSR